VLSRLNLSFQIFYLRREQGRLAELEPTMRAMALEQADVPAFGAALSLLLAELGHLEEARSIVDRLSADQYGRLRDRNWPVSWFQLARAVSLIGDRDRAVELYQHGQIMAGQCIMVSLATVSLGSADLALAWLADTAGHTGEADQWYRRAAVSNSRIGARSWLAQTRADHARSLARLDTDEARTEAARLASMALDAATDIGLGEVAAVATGVLAGLASPSETQGSETRAEFGGPSAGVFRRDGSVWELAFSGVTVRMPHAKGLVDIARLLSQPNESVHVSEMLPARANEVAGVIRSVGSAGDVLDERARREIRAHLADLSAEEDEAAAMNDLERANRIGIERDFLVHELAVAAGIRGRPRRLDDVSERARKTVTARIHKCIARIEQVHPSLARHLDRSIDTGLWCVYRPEQQVDWKL
jgi:hypothetical protein